MVRYFSPIGIITYKRRITDLEEQIAALEKQVNESCSQGAETTHDNAPFEVLKNDIGILDTRIREAYSILNEAVVKEYPKPHEVKCVGYGTQVMFERDGKAFDFMIVGYGENNVDKGKILYDCPVALAIEGHKIGEIFRVKINGVMSHIKIKEVHHLRKQ